MKLPMIEDPVPDSPRSYIQREEHSSPVHILELVDPMESIGPQKGLYFHLLLRGGQLGYARLCRKQRNILLDLVLLEKAKDLISFLNTLL